MISTLMTNLMDLKKGRARGDVSGGLCAGVAVELVYYRKSWFPDKLTVRVPCLLRAMQVDR